MSQWICKDFKINVFDNSSIVNTLQSQPHTLLSAAGENPPVMLIKVIITKKNGIAVERNKMKRRIRTIFHNLNKTKPLTLLIDNKVNRKIYNKANPLTAKIIIYRSSLTQDFFLLTSHFSSFIALYPCQDYNNLLRLK